MKLYKYAFVDESLYYNFLMSMFFFDLAEKWLFGRIVRLVFLVSCDMFVASVHL